MMPGSTADDQLTELTDVSRHALEDYDALLHKYNQLVDEHNQTKVDLHKLHQVLEPMLDEYGQIKTKYDVEKSLRAAAEDYAIKMVKDNKKIKRQSNMILQHMSMKAIPIDIDIDAVEEDSSSEQEAMVGQLNQSISDLKGEIAGLKTELRKVKDENSLLSEQVDQLKTERDDYQTQYFKAQTDLKTHTSTFQQQQRELKSLKRVSGLAYTDYQSLQDRYELEKTLRLKAESYASELQRKRNSALEVKRASLQEVSSDSATVNESLKQALAENESLVAELSEKETEYKQRVTELETQLKGNSSHDALENMEEKLSAMSEEVDRITTDLEDVTQQKQELVKKVAKLEKERKEFMNIPLPPPPPPPPGPAKGILKSVKDIISDSKTKKANASKKVLGKDVQNDAMNDAMKEMMERIQKGKPLKPVDMNARPLDMKPGSDGAAMEEMHKILVSFKKNNLETTRQNTAGQPQPESELARKLNTRLNRSENTIDNLDLQSSKGVDPVPQQTKDTELTQRLDSHPKVSKTVGGADSTTEPSVALPVAAVRSCAPVPQVRRPVAKPRIVTGEGTPELEQVFSQRNKERVEE